MSSVTALVVGSCLLAALVSSSTRAAPPELRARNRVEADAAVDQILRGQTIHAALARLKYLGEEAWAAGRLMEALEQQTHPESRRQLALALASLRVPRTEAVLAELAADEDAAVRMSAAEGLGRLRSRRVQVLAPLLNDRNPGVRRKAAEALGFSGDRRQGKALIQAARREDDPEARTEMLVAVGRVQDKSQIQALESFLRHSSESTRFSAARALCLLGARSGQAFARKLLHSEEKTERRQGLALYEGAQAKVARPALTHLLEDAEPSLAAAAGRILYQGGEKEMLEWLVLQSHASRADAKMSYERELETLMLTDAQRLAILRRKGRVP